MQKPNILFLLVDELRHPTGYESKEMKEFLDNLPGFKKMREEGCSFEQHYIASSACAPSRASLYTGQYPTLTGVISTDGAGKSAYDAEMNWLDPNNIPTLGHYFRKLGYRTSWIGKWHVTDADILIPGSNTPVASYDQEGKPTEEGISYYERTNRLDAFGFSDWIGPEPHGANPLNTGESAKNASGRDPFYVDQAISHLRLLKKEKQPWFLVLSLVNPHDIALYGLQTNNPLTNFDFSIVPENAVPEQVFSKDFLSSLNDDLSKKPKCQASYRASYRDWFPFISTQPKEANYYLRVYYNLIRKVDRHILRILEEVENEENLVTLLTSDHGDLLGSHNWMHQKWYQSYQEVVHVPCFLRWSGKIRPNSIIDSLTSHIDLLPTLLSIADGDHLGKMSCFWPEFLNFQPLPGKSLLPLFSCPNKKENRAVLFLTQDNIVRGPGTADFLGLPPTQISSPTSIFTLIVQIHQGEYQGFWKYSSYVDSKNLWTNPPFFDDYINVFRYTCQDGIPPPEAVSFCNLPTCVNEEDEGITLSACVNRDFKKNQAENEYELYNLLDDPYEVNNLAIQEEYSILEERLNSLLKRIYEKRALTPLVGTLPGAVKVEQL